VGPMACETIDNNGYVLQLVGGALSGRFQQPQTAGVTSQTMGTVLPKGCKEFWPVGFSLNMRR
jgi:hypothetical protein